MKVILCSYKNICGRDETSRCPALIQLPGIGLVGLEDKWDFRNKTPSGRDSPICQGLYELLWGANCEWGGGGLFKRNP